MSEKPPFKDIAIIGGGAAGFFAALSCKNHRPDCEVTIIERSNKLLSKVRVSGGGRCNVTNHCFANRELIKNYPRGGKWLHKAFNQFSVADTIQWFAQRNVELKTEHDMRMFPVSNSSLTIIDCLLSEARKAGVSIQVQSPVQSIQKAGDKFLLTIHQRQQTFDAVVIATGGSPKLEGYAWLKNLGHTIVPPVPSLFTFNIPESRLTELMGVSVPCAEVRVQGTKLRYSGPLLVTHWGMSGPAILKLSAFGADYLSRQGYEFTVLVNWTGEYHEGQIREKLEMAIQAGGRGSLRNLNPFGFPNRLWVYLIGKAEIPAGSFVNQLGKKDINRLVNVLVNDTYECKGKTTFKEEFVTAGGVDLEEVDPSTMQSKIVSGLYFAGEVLNVDGITGGFNFQAAWTTGWVAGLLR